MCPGVAVRTTSRHRSRFLALLFVLIAFGLSLSPTQGVESTRDRGTEDRVWTITARTVILQEPLTVQIDSPAAGAFLAGVVTVSGTANGSGLLAVEVRVDSGIWQNATGTSAWTLSLDTGTLTDGARQIAARSTDGTNDSAEATVAVTVDNTPPSLSIHSPQAGSFVASSFFSSIWTVSDAGSGVDHVSIQLDTDPALVLPGSSFGLSFSNVPEGAHTLSIRAFDRAGNTRLAFVAFTADGTPATTTLTVFGTRGQGGWFTSGVNLFLTAVDSLAGVETISVRVDANPFAPFTNYTSPISIRNDGVYTFSYYATDAVGNVEETHAIQIPIDGNPPNLQISPHPTFFRQSDVLIAWTGTDAMSGITRYEVNVDAGPYEGVGLATSKFFPLSDGEHTVHVRAVDAAGLRTNRSAHVTVDTNAFSLTGPYVGAPTIAIPLVIGAVTFVLFWRRRQQRRGGKEPVPKTGEGPST